MAATLQFRLTGGAANSDPDASLGGTMSSEQVSGTALNNLFDDVTPTEASAGDTEYRAIDIYNSGDDTATGIEIYFDTQTPSSDTVIALGLDATATQELANESTAPDSPAVSFTEPTSGSPLSLDDLSAGSAHRIFLRRTVSASAGNANSDECGITVEYA